MNKQKPTECIIVNDTIVKKNYSKPKIFAIISSTQHCPGGLMSSHGKSQNMKTKGIVIRKKKQLVICINLTVYVKNTEYVGALYINM